MLGIYTRWYFMPGLWSQLCCVTDCNSKWLRIFCNTCTKSTVCTRQEIAIRIHLFFKAWLQWPSTCLPSFHQASRTPLPQCSMMCSIICLPPQCSTTGSITHLPPLTQRSCLVKSFPKVHLLCIREIESKMTLWRVVPKFAARCTLSSSSTSI